MSQQVLVKTGAIVSSIGVALLITFVTVLLAFPVIKECKGEEKCVYNTTAPEQLAVIVQPTFLAISLMVIAGGVFMVRFSRWRDSKETEGGY